MDNATRAKRARLTLRKYGAKMYGPGDHEPLETLITDMLSDLRHLCDAEGLAFVDLDQSAYRHYTQERAA